MVGCGVQRLRQTCGEPHVYDFLMHEIRLKVAAGDCTEYYGTDQINPLLVTFGTQRQMTPAAFTC